MTETTVELRYHGNVSDGRALADHGDDATATTGARCCEQWLYTVTARWVRDDDDLLRCVQVTAYGDNLTSTDLRDVSFLSMRTQAAKQIYGRQLQIPGKRVPRPGPDPDERWWQHLADAYLARREQSPSPVLDLATDSGVPLNTARRWVAEARKLGYLPKDDPRGRREK